LIFAAARREVPFGAGCILRAVACAGCTSSHLRCARNELDRAGTVLLRFDAFARRDQVARIDRCARTNVASKRAAAGDAGCRASGGAARAGSRAARAGRRPTTTAAYSGRNHGRSSAATSRIRLRCVITAPCADTQDQHYKSHHHACAHGLFVRDAWEQCSFKRVPPPPTARKRRTRAQPAPRYQ